MAVSIYSAISNWATGINYKKFTPVKSGGKTYYALRDHLSGASFDADSVFWGGYTADPSGKVLANQDGSNTRPHFFFIPSYGSNFMLEPRSRISAFGEGYEQRLPESINNSLLKIDLTFETRDSQETKAINLFLQERSATEAFLFTPPDPFASLKLFVCRKWSNTNKFFNNNTVTTTFEEVPL